MNEDNVYSIVREIYATFGKSAPARTSDIVSAVARRTADIPDRVSQYIIDRVTDRPTMPANLSQAMREAWNAYCLAHPTARSERNTCRYCYGNGGWVYFKSDSDGRIWQYWSFCPHCQPENESVRKTPRMLMDEGTLVVPSDYPGGVARFRMDHLIDEPAPVNEYAQRSIEAIRARFAGNRIQPGYCE